MHVHERVWGKKIPFFFSGAALVGAQGTAQMGKAVLSEHGKCCKDMLLVEEQWRSHPKYLLQRRAETGSLMTINH